MINFKHLTERELAAYSQGALERRESDAFGTHLLHCAECRKRLPMPSVERFWSIVMTETEEESLDGRKNERFGGFLTSAFLKLNYGFAWGGAALVIILSFSFLLWLSFADSGREIVREFPNESGSELKFPLPKESPSNEKPVSVTNSNPVGVNPNPKVSKTIVPKQKILEKTSPQDFNKTNANPPKATIAATRGVSAKCEENNSIELEFFSSKENLVFKWKAIPKAAKYHLYISDDEEILIDEFETPTETTFVLKKPLDPLKTYKWKIIVTLENGQQVVGDSQKFTMKDFQTKQKKIEMKRGSETRCSANN